MSCSVLTGSAQRATPPSLAETWLVIVRDAGHALLMLDNAFLAHIGPRVLEVYVVMNCIGACKIETGALWGDQVRSMQLGVDVELRHIG